LEKNIYIVREQVGDNPVNKVSQRTMKNNEGRMRILHRNMLLLVNDLHVDLLPHPVKAVPTKQSRGRNCQLTPRERYHTATPPPPDSDDDEGKGRNWLRIPILREQRTGMTSLPKLRPPRVPQRNPTQGEASQSAVPTRAAVPVERIRYREERQIEIEYLPELDQPGDVVEEDVDPVREERRVDEDVSEEQVRRSTRDRRPRKVYTYEMLGEPSLQPTVNTVGACSIQYTPGWGVAYNNQPPYQVAPYHTTHYRTRFYLTYVPFTYPTYVH